MIIDKDTGELLESLEGISEEIPDAMLHAKRWLLWKEVPHPVVGKNPRKVPFYISGFTRKSTDTEEDLFELATFEHASEAILNSPEPYAGLGFALGPDGTGNYWQGIDFDEISKHAHLQVLWNDLPGYVESSPNGDGVHAISYGKEFKSIGSSKEDGIEAYSTGRFFTVTGAAHRCESFTDLTDFVEQVLRPYEARRAKNFNQIISHGEHSLSPAQVADIRSALTRIRSDDYDTWVQFGLALKKHGEDGRSLWMEWSQSSDVYDPAEARNKWETFPIDTKNEIDYRHILKEAQGLGWVNPKSNINQAMVHDPVYDEPIGNRFFSGNFDYIEYTVDGFIGTGVTVIAGAAGVGKTSAVVPIAAIVAGLWKVPNINIVLRRKVIYVTEDPGQLRRIVKGMMMSAENVASASEFDEWFHVIPANRRKPEQLAKSIEFWRERYSYEAEANQNHYMIDPLIIFDTSNATIDLDNENDNAEIGRAIGSIKKTLNGGSMWLIAHLAKAITRTSAPDELSPRGGGAWVGDAHGVAFLVKDEDIPDKRFFVLGKKRFEAAFNEMEMDTITGNETVSTPWGEIQDIVYRFGIPQPLFGDDSMEARKAEVSARNKNMDDSMRLIRVLDYIKREWKQAMDEGLYSFLGVSTNKIYEEIGGKKTYLLEALAELTDAQKVEINVQGEHKNATKYYRPAGEK